MKSKLGVALSIERKDLTMPEIKEVHNIATYICENAIKAQSYSFKIIDSSTCLHIKNVLESGLYGCYSLREYNCEKYLYLSLNYESSQVFVKYEQLFIEFLNQKYPNVLDRTNGVYIVNYTTLQVKYKINFSQLITNYVSYSKQGDPRVYGKSRPSEFFLGVVEFNSWGEIVYQNKFNSKVQENENNWEKYLKNIFNMYFEELSSRLKKRELAY